MSGFIIEHRIILVEVVVVDDEVTYLESAMTAIKDRYDRESDFWLQKWRLWRAEFRDGKLFSWGPDPAIFN